MATVTATNTTAMSSSSKKKIIWMWKSNSDPWNENEQEEWEHYSDLEILVIEEAYEQKKDKVELPDSIINFKEMLQVSNLDKSKQRPVKRQKEMEVSQTIRKERFCFPELPTPVTSVPSFTTSGGGWSEFITEWIKKNEAIAEEKKEQWSKIVEQAAQGILKESILLDKESQGKLIFNKLMEVKDANSPEIFKCCAILYSAASFLYEFINSSLRADDRSKIDTIGAYCYLLRKHLMNSGRPIKKLILYRGAQFTDEMIEAYKQACGSTIKWLGFTSTSRDPEVAKFFSGNTLFIIEIQTEYMSKTYLSDIALISRNPDEKEVLLQAGHYFQVEKVELKDGKYLIYLVY